MFTSKSIYGGYIQCKTMYLTALGIWQGSISPRETKTFFVANHAGQLSLWDLEACSVLSVLSLDAYVHCMTLLRGCEVSVLLGLSHSPALITVRSTSITVTKAAPVSTEGDLFGESSSSEEEEEDS